MRSKAPAPGRLRRILTVGHSTHSLEDFLALLRVAGVGVLADVRRFPGSRRMPWFSSESLAAAAPHYAHLPELGGRRSRVRDSPNTAWRVPAFQGYADHMETDEFRAGIARLEELARERLTAIMCAEVNWWQCHRRLISDALVVRGWRVEHLAPGRLTAHELTEFAVVDGTRITYPGGVLFGEA